VLPTCAKAIAFPLHPSQDRQHCHQRLGTDLEDASLLHIDLILDSDSELTFDANLYSIRRSHLALLDGME
jgi:hypothetical protein